MYAAIQNQLSEIQMQLNFILTTLTTLSYEEGITKERVNILEANTKDIVSTLIDLTNDSETTHEKIKQESDK
jgi:archaellum component FlaC